jgi:hypothetical protein
VTTIKHRAEWLFKRKWGIFIHFLADIGSAAITPEEWNRKVDAFDVKKFAIQLSELKAGYCFLTLGQNSGYYCSPNSTYDRLLGYTAGTSKCSRRDLFLDLANELNKYGIPLLAYNSSLAPTNDIEALKALRCVPSWDFGSQEILKDSVESCSRLSDFQRHWEAINREWSLRWGNKLKGWWIDGCYYREQLYNHADEPNYHSFSAALRAGNPDALLAFNPGVEYPPFRVCDEEDYTAGEINDPWRGVWNGRYIDGAQYHVLTFVGSLWGKPVHYTPGEIAAASANIIQQGGVVSWDVPFSKVDGSLETATFNTLMTFSSLLRETLESGRTMPQIELKVDKVPGWNNRLWLPGRVTATFHNPSDKPIKGIIDTEIAFNGKQGAGVSKIAYDLQPGGKMTKDMRFENMKEKPDYAIVCFKDGQLEHSFRIPCCKEICLHESPEDHLGIWSKKDRLAEISISKKDDSLAVSGMVFEEISVPAHCLWQGSCMELFFSDTEEPENRQQFFLPPGVNSTPAAYRQNGSDYVPENAIEVKNRRCRNGYRLDATIPLALLKFSSMKHRKFNFEMQLTVKSGEGFITGTLFGSIAPASNSEYYAEIKV